MKSSSVFGVVTALSVAAVLFLNGPLILGQGASPVSPSPSSTHQVSPSGLWLELSIGQTAIAAGQPIVISVDSFNPSDSPVNVTAGKSWVVQGLRADACYSSIYPFGVAVFKGAYTLANVTNGTPLQIFPTVPCPLLMRLITGYYFGAGSRNATVLPGAGSSVAMSVQLTINGTYPTAGQGTTVRNFAPGTYTVLAGDEWGALAFLWFRVG